MKQQQSRRKETSRRRFGVLSFAGLGGITEGELAPSGASGFVRATLPNYDLTVCELSPRGVGVLGKLRTAEDVFLMAGAPRGLAAGQLRAICNSALSQAAILEAIALKNSIFPGSRPKRPTVACFVKQDHDYKIRRREIVDSMMAAIGRSFPKWRYSDPATMECWGFLIDGKLQIGIRLSDGSMRYRGRSPAKREAALRPTIAAALVAVADPGKGETVLDPMCGTGTIPAEAMAWNRQTTVEGGDIDAAAVAMARERLAETGVALNQWDARKLPHGSGSVDCIVSNIPFGKQHSSVQANRKLYRDLLSEWIRVLKPKGRMVLLTADTKSLQQAAANVGLDAKTAGKVKVLGVWARIYRISGSS